MTPTRNTHVPAPGPACATYAPLLPLVAHRLLASDEEAGVREHVASCTRCRMLLAAYDQLDTALRRSAERASRDAPPVEEVVEIVEQQEFGTPAAPPVAEPMRWRAPKRVFSLIGAVAAVVMVALLAQALFANAGGARAGSGGAGPRGPSGPASQGGLAPDYTALAMVSPSDGWLFGLMRANEPPESTCSGCVRLVLHYDGTHWQRLPAPTDKVVSAVSMLSSSDGWAVAEDAILHYTGGAWRVAYTYDAGPGHTIFLRTIAMDSADDGWVGGTDGTTGSSIGLLLHYTHGRWQRVSFAGETTASSINSISMLSPTEGWAGSQQFVGDQTKVLVLHYIQGQWQPVQTGFNGSLDGICALPDGEVWAVGYASGTTGMILYYYKGKWIQVASPTPNILHAITMRSATDGWAVGDGAATLHWDGTQWTKVGLVIHGVALMSVAMPSADEGWAIGPYESGDTSQPSVILRYSSGNWSVYDLKIGG